MSDVSLTNRGDGLRTASPSLAPGRVAALAAVVAAVGLAAAIGAVRLRSGAHGLFGSGRPVARDGISVGCEARVAWVPRALVEAAGREAGPVDLGSNAAVRAFLERHRLDGFWCGLSYRSHREDGGVAEITQAFRSADLPAHPAEFAEIVELAAGRTPPSRRMDFARVRLEVIPDELVSSPPIEALGQLGVVPETPRS